MLRRFYITVFLTCTIGGLASSCHKNKTGPLAYVGPAEAVQPSLQRIGQRAEAIVVSVPTEDWPRVYAYIREISDAWQDYKHPTVNPSPEPRRFPAGMAVSNYLSTRSRREEVETARNDEYWQVEEFPEGEQREIREIFRSKGFRGSVLDHIVEVITRNRDVWVDTMLLEELDLQKVTSAPWRSATATFLAFVVFGFVPLLPFFVPVFPAAHLFIASCILSCAAFAGIGVLKGLVLQRSPLRSGLLTLVVGGIAAALAYSVGVLLRIAFGISSANGG